MLMYLGLLIQSPAGREVHSFLTLSPGIYHGVRIRGLLEYSVLCSDIYHAYHGVHSISRLGDANT